MSTDTRLFTCNLCEALCGLELTVEKSDSGTERITKVRGDSEDVFSRGHICPKGPAMVEFLEDPDRLKMPVRRTASGGWEEVSWDDALDEAATRLRAIRNQHGNDAVAIYVGNPTAHSHRAALGSQMLTGALATRHRFDANSQDSNPRLFACMQVYGDGLSIPVPDVERTDLLIILGANPAITGGSHMGLGDVRGRMKAIRERGGRVIVIDPRRSETASQFADSHHFIRPGGDAALLLAMLHVIFAERLADEEALEAQASGTEALRALAARFSPERVAPAIAMSPSVIRSLARELARTRRAVLYARVGVCQNEFGPTASWLVEAINIVTGHFDREGGAMFTEPAADIGPIARLVVGNNYARWRSRVRGLPEFLGALPSAVMAEEMETPGEGQIRALVCFAGNPVLSTPNGERLSRALPNLDFILAIDPYLNETTRHAHLVLPPAHVFRTGNFDLLLFPLAVRNVVKLSDPVLERREGDRDDWEILSELAVRLRGPAWKWLARAWRERMRGLPDRVMDLLLRFGGAKLSLGKLRAAPHGIDLGPLRPLGRARLHTEDGRAHLAPDIFMSDVARLERWLADERPALLLIGRRHLRSNNSWMHNLRSLVKGPDRGALLMHPEDAASRSLVDGQRVRVTSRVGSVEARLLVSAEVMRGVASLPHGFGHAAARDTLRVAGALDTPSANALTDEELVEPLLGTSILGGVPIEVTSIAGGATTE